MQIKVLCLSFLLILIYSTSFSQKKEAPIDAALTKCLDKKENQTTAGMCNCTYAALNDWDKQLNSTYKSLLLRLDSLAKPKLIEAQRQWIKFKEKEIELIDATYGKAQGTMWLVIRADKLLQITKSRAEELEILLETLDEIQG
jgi:uncharacterized protein YecT (DUF1311 family)